MSLNRVPRWSPEEAMGKGYFEQLLEGEEVEYSLGDGIWVLHGFHPITICIEMGY